MTTPPLPTTRHFVVSVDVADGHANTDLVQMQDGLQHAADIARREGMLTSHDDLETTVTGIQVATCPRIDDLVLVYFGGRIEDSEEARRAISDALATVAANYNSSRLQLLNEQDRELLVEGIGLVRQRSAIDDNNWVPEMVRNGHDAWIRQTDAEIISEAVLAAYCLDDMDADRQVEVIRLLARAEGVMRFIQSTATDEQLGELREKLVGTIDCMAGSSEWEEAAPLVEHLLDELAAVIEVDDQSDTPGM